MNLHSACASHRGVKRRAWYTLFASKRVMARTFLDIFVIINDQAWRLVESTFSASELLCLDSVPAT